jgi:hypothetical protein
MGGDGLLSITDGSHDIERARKHDEESRVLIADVEQHFSPTYLAALSDARDPLNLGRRELWEYLRGSVYDGGGHRFVSNAKDRPQGNNFLHFRLGKQAWIRPGISSIRGLDTLGFDAPLLTAQTTAVQIDVPVMF